MAHFDDTRRSLLRLTGGVAGALVLPAAAQTGERAGKGKGNGGKDEPPASPAEELMHDHGVLDRVLLLYEETLRRMGGGEQVAQLDVVADAAEIVRSYIQGRHEKLEETYVFPPFERSTAKEHADLVQVLRVQHEAGRRLTDRILKLSKTKIEDPVSRTQIQAALRDFIRMYRPHESREETVLFPAFRRLVPASEYSALGAEFRKADRQAAGGGLEMMVEKISSLERQLGVYDLSKFTPKS